MTRRIGLELEGSGPLMAATPAKRSGAAHAVRKAIVPPEPGALLPRFTTSLPSPVVMAVELPAPVPRTLTMSFPLPVVIDVVPAAPLTLYISEPPASVMAVLADELPVTATVSPPLPI